MKKSQKAYEEIFKVLEKHKEHIIFDINSLRSDSKNHLFGLKLKHEYGLDINPELIYNRGYQKINDHIAISYFGDDDNRSISWEDNGNQPDNELLLVISFPTGAYIFDRDYPIKLFKEFFQELKSYNPKYIDSANHCLYYSMDNAKEVFNNFHDILSKYKERNKKDSKEREIEKLKKELEDLEK